MIGNYPNLKQRKLVAPYPDEVWSLENIKDGLEYFKELNGRYPTSREVDNFDYLPSARTIQRSHGGMVQIRKKLNLSGPHQFSKGETRSLKAREADKRAQGYEKEFFYFLSSKLPEINIHEHKIIRPGDVACDFFIYTTQTEGMILDLFYAADIINAAKIINIKYKKYLGVKFPVIFIVVGNENIEQAKLDQMMKNRKIALPKWMTTITENYFKLNFDRIIQLK